MCRFRSPREGIFARLIECIDGSWDLPSKDADFLCGMEFAILEDERRYYQRHGIDLDVVERGIALAAGELLLFDNLAIAHGRAGRRPARELNQLCIGFKSADHSVQTRIRDELVAHFAQPTRPAAVPTDHCCVATTDDTVGG